MGLLNTVGSALWRMGHSLGSWRPQNANELRDYDTLEDMLRNEPGMVGRAMSSSGEMVSVDRAMQVATVYACVRVRSEAIAQCPVEVFYRDIAPDGKRTRTLALDRPEYKVLTMRPNEWQSSFEFWEMVSRDLDLRGNSYSLMSRNSNDEVIELIRMHPDKVTPKQDDRTMAVTYEYRRSDGSMVIIPRRDVLHVRGAGYDGVRGLSPIQDHARNAIGLAMATETHGAKFFGNGARPGSVLLADGNMGGDAKAAIREDWEKMYLGSEQSNRVAILDQGIKFEALHVNNEEAQFLETRKYQRSEITGIFKVPPHMIGDLERATFSNIEHQSIDFVNNGLRPTFRRIAQAVQRDVFRTEEPIIMQFDPSELLRGDAKSYAEAKQIERRNGVISADEWRDDIGLNARGDEGGNEYIVESNMVSQTDGMPTAESEAAQ